ncbi:unnamed protein product [Rotaria sp. Silwood1]|nr:unnamed protein product [Rotaria sp. Silwood1]CAF1631146.1 unnamed protein product [Rotaria sp. Silwood1]CAF3745875.1 unnamed protein product [Rotaria sp. Silwood1]CAF5033035.1 unnamed protein product [Rotaria sp. Silwood1]
MSTEIEDNTDIHSNDEVNQDSNELSQEIDQPLSSENEREEKQVQELSIDDKQEIESRPILTSNNNELPSESPSTDVIIEKEDDSTAATISEENSSALPLSEETSLVLPECEQDNNNAVGDTIQSESSN